ncbi:DUF123 domain-containing protein [Halobacteriales archaeon QS_3_64_16]|nr:MAG: DUF123 domain-containing protein [Halobacteriales archaeon QS_3_64_16]
MTESRAKGTYTLLIELEADTEIEVGALGHRDFPAGWYAYIGSALGTGGFSRIDRHQEVASGAHDVRHWHIDYLLGHPAARIDSVETSAGVDAECAVARALPGDRVVGFGASDCGCDSHLAYAAERAELSRVIENVHAGQQQ